MKLDLYENETEEGGGGGEESGGGEGADTTVNTEGGDANIQQDAPEAPAEDKPAEDEASS